MNDSNDSNQQLFTILAIVSLVCGIISITCCCCTLFQMPIPIAGIVTGYFGLQSVQQNKLAKTGIILSIIGLVLSVGYFIFSLTVQMANPSFLEQLKRLQSGGATP